MRATAAASATIDHAASSAESSSPSTTFINGCCMEGTSGTSTGLSPGTWTRPLSPPAINDKTKKST